MSRGVDVDDAGIGDVGGVAWLALVFPLTCRERSPVVRLDPSGVRVSREDKREGSWKTSEYSLYLRLLTCDPSAALLI